MRCDLEMLRALRMSGVRELVLDGDDVASVEFFEVTDDERQQAAMELLSSEQRAALNLMNEDELSKYRQQQAEALLYHSA